MQTVQPAIVEADEFTSDGTDKLFGVCHAIGEDFGFDPFYLRVAIFALALFGPIPPLVAYVVLGAAVALSHWLFPDRRQKPSSVALSQAEEREFIQPHVTTETAQERGPELLAA